MPWRRDAKRSKASRRCFSWRQLASLTLGLLAVAVVLTLYAQDSQQLIPGVIQDDGSAGQSPVRLVPMASSSSASDAADLSKESSADQASDQSDDKAEELAEYSHAGVARDLFKFPLDPMKLPDPGEAPDERPNEELNSLRTLIQSKRKPELADSRSRPQEEQPPAAVNAPATKWEFCSNQFEKCTCEGRMRWGTEKQFQVFVHDPEGWDCRFDVLGDPAPGEISKKCECEVDATPISKKEPKKMKWIFCASQFMLCQCPGRVRWGNKNRWKVLVRSKTAYSCTTEKLGDPTPGDAGKHCECEVDRESDFYRKSVSPGATHGDDGDFAAEKVRSCDIFEAAAQSGQPWDKTQWIAVEGICGKADLGRAGPLGLDASSLRRMLDAWVPEAFLENYRRIYETPWLEEAFVNFIGSSPSGGKWARINEQLVRSVHMFSTRPVLVVHFGMSIPTEWDPVKFPRLVVMNMAPFPTHHFRRFDLNKYRSLLAARVKTGIQLDSDQFVAPGVDALFARAQAESSASYPLPILPVHFMTNEQLPMYPQGGKPGVTMSGGQSVVFNRFCKKGDCPGVTTRWGHAHPTWTYWALPFLGSWLRRHLRDEVLEALNGDAHTALRVTDIDVDEDLLNIGTWEEKGHKQWCKFDVMDPVEFWTLIKGKASKQCSGPPTAPIQSDSRFHPKGAPIVFYTAHHAVDPVASAEILDKLDEKLKKGSLPPPIYFMGCFYKDFAELKKAHPQIRCLI